MIIVLRGCAKTIHSGIILFNLLLLRTKPAEQVPSGPKPGDVTPITTSCDPDLQPEPPTTGGQCSKGSYLGNLPPKCIANNS